MTWYDEALFYHIYPLGLLGAEKQNPYGEVQHRLKNLKPWIAHLKDLGVGGLYIGPLFESEGHGYETTDYRRVDSRLGSNEDLKEFVRECHENGIRVVLDGVFNHTGRNFFAFRDLKENRENSRYRDWYCNVNFRGNNEYNDGFSYDNWGGYNLLVKLNQKNPEVVNYILDTIRFWVSEFDIDGIRLDTADVLDFDFMRAMRSLADEVKPDFWLMGEVIHGEYQRWVNPSTLHSVTDYPLHKALYSGHNDHNYFEIAHTLNRFMQNGIDCTKLYSFVDNHDVERIYSKLNDKRCWEPVHILLFCLPGIPSIYYGSEFAVEGKKERWSDDSIRPALDLDELLSKENPYYEVVKALGKIYRNEKALVYGEYRQLHLTTGQYIFARGDVMIGVNNADQEAAAEVRCPDGVYHGALHGGTYRAENGVLHFNLPACGGEILIPEGKSRPEYKPVKAVIKKEMKKEEKLPEIPKDVNLSKPYEEMSVPELQAAILAKMAANGPVTDRMKQDVAENVYRDSLLNWVRSFR